MAYSSFSAQSWGHPESDSSTSHSTTTTIHFPLSAVPRDWKAQLCTVWRLSVVLAVWVMGMTFLSLGSDIHDQFQPDLPYAYTHEIILIVAVAWMLQDVIGIRVTEQQNTMVDRILYDLESTQLIIPHYDVEIVLQFRVFYESVYIPLCVVAHYPFSSKKLGCLRFLSNLSYVMVWMCRALILVSGFVLVQPLSVLFFAAILLLISAIVDIALYVYGTYNNHVVP
jgi:hypothetical protein